MQKCKRNLKRQNNIKQTIKNTIQDIKIEKDQNDQKEIKSNNQVAAVSYWSFKS